MRERLGYAIKELNTGHLMVLCQFGSMPPELAKKNTSETVCTRHCPTRAATLQQLEENRWWPQPLDRTASQRAKLARLRMPRMHMQQSTGQWSSGANVVVWPDLAVTRHERHNKTNLPNHLHDVLRLQRDKIPSVSK